MKNTIDESSAQGYFNVDISYLKKESGEIQVII